MEYKVLRLDELKTDGDEGVFKGYASVFGKRDLQDDVVEEGAFTRTIKENRGEFPVLFQHDVMSPIGKIVEASEDRRGLKIAGKLSLGVQRAAEVLALLRDKVLNGLSIGYRAVKWENDTESGARHLQEIDLFEVSPVVFPANPAARISSVKRGHSPRRRDDVPDFDWDAVPEVSGELEPGAVRRAFSWVDELARR